MFPLCACQELTPISPPAAQCLARADAARAPPGVAPTRHAGRYCPGPAAPREVGRVTRRRRRAGGAGGRGLEQLHFNRPALRRLCVLVRTALAEVERACGRPRGAATDCPTPRCLRRWRPALPPRSAPVALPRPSQPSAWRGCARSRGADGAGPLQSQHDRSTRRRRRRHMVALAACLSSDGIRRPLS
jgi:hypothetical protein